MKSELKKHALSGPRRYGDKVFDDMLHPQLFDVIKEKRLEQKEKTPTAEVCPRCKVMVADCGDTYCVCRSCGKVFERR